MIAYCLRSGRIVLDQFPQDAYLIASGTSARVDTAVRANADHEPDGSLWVPHVATAVNDSEASFALMRFEIAVREAIHWPHYSSLERAEQLLHFALSSNDDSTHPRIRAAIRALKA